MKRIGITRSRSGFRPLETASALLAAFAFVCSLLLGCTCGPFCGLDVASDDAAQPAITAQQGSCSSCCHAGEQPRGNAYADESGTPCFSTDLSDFILPSSNGEAPVLSWQQVATIIEYLELPTTPPLQFAEDPHLVTDAANDPPVYIQLEIFLS